MKTRIFLLLLCCCLANTLYAQESSYEHQRVVLASGEEELLWISLDEQSDQLRYKSSESDKFKIYNPAAVMSFRYGGQNYYSLPLRDGYITFFKVYHEGEEFAVLDKLPNYKILRAIVDESGGGLAMCQHRNNHEFYLCHQTNYNTFTPGIPSRGVSEYRIKQLVFLVLEGKLMLVYLETDERFNFLDDFKGPKPGKRKVENMLEEFIKDQDKIRLIQKRVKEQKLDIRKPEDLVKALSAVYQ